jgi:hypothetical protein
LPSRFRECSRERYRKVDHRVAPAAAAVKRA